MQENLNHYVTAILGALVPQSVIFGGDTRGHFIAVFLGVKLECCGWTTEVTVKRL